MKKLIGIFAIAALTTSAFAQGTVSFSNNTGLVQQWTSLTDSVLISVPKSGGSVELLFAPAGTALANSALTSFSSLSGFLGANPGWAASATTTILPVVAGSFNGGNVALTGIAGGANANYAIIGWTGAFATYDLAFAAGTSMLGISPMFTTATGNPSTTPPGSPIGLKNTFTGLVLAPGVIPEPSTFALAGLGAAALLIFRRRK